MKIANDDRELALSQLPIINIENTHASAKLSLFGAHLLSFVPKHDGRERIWLSEKAVFDGSKAIRGGIPICWPWFGDCKQPAHGFARTTIWDLISQIETASGTVLVLQLPPQSDTQIELRLTVHIGETLSLQLETTNLGQNDFEFTCALHSYFCIPNIATVSLEGLHGTYQDKTRDGLIFQTPSPYRFSEETDRVHHCAAECVQITDNRLRTTVNSTGHDSIVVWNPGLKKCLQMSDMTATGFEQMLCVETAITTPSTIEPGNTHSLTQTIR